MLGFAPLTRDLGCDHADAPHLELALLPFEEIKQHSGYRSYRRTCCIHLPRLARPLRRTSPMHPTHPAKSIPNWSARPRKGSSSTAVSTTPRRRRSRNPARLAMPVLDSVRCTPAASGSRSVTPRSMRAPSRSAPSAHRVPTTPTCSSLGSIGGPFKIPGVRNRPVFFAGYQHSTRSPTRSRSRP